MSAAEMKKRPSMAKFRLSTKLVIAANKISKEFSDHRQLPPGRKAPKPEGVPDDGHDDLCQVNAFEPEKLIAMLQMRHHQQTVYTRIGARSILISINPYSKVEGPFTTSFYGGFTAKRYYKAASDESKKGGAAVLAPHVYQIAADAYVRCLGIGPISSEKKKNQTIVATGESGAGKTENVRQILDFCAYSSRQPPKASGVTLSKLLEEANCILEAFGNAKTQRNDNSSRFGKLVTLHMRMGAGYGAVGELVGMKMQTYLLEKPRLSKPNLGERNYHVFYMLLRGLEAGELEKRGLLRPPAIPPPKEKNSIEYATEAEAFATYEPILGANDMNVHAQWDDKGDFADLKSALLTLMTRHRMVEDIGGTETQKGKNAATLCGELWDVLAALLHLGKAKLVQDEAKTKTAPEPVKLAGGVPMWEDPSELEWPTKLLGLSGVCDSPTGPGSLGFWLLNTKTQFAPKGKTLSLNKANSAHRACVQFLFATLFDWLVDGINNSSGGDDVGKGGGDNDLCCMNVLDIFGFESFKVNSLEQLCINLANERLQTNFENVILEQEKEEIQREGVDLASVHLDGAVDESGRMTELIVDKIFAEITGIIKTGDGTSNVSLYKCVQDNVSRENYASENDRLKMGRWEIIAKDGKSSYVPAPKKKGVEGSDLFTIKHFAAPVTYDSSEMVEKSGMEGNLPLNALLLESSNRLVKDLIEFHKMRQSERAKATKLPKGDKPTVGVSFKGELTNLTDRINETEVHYVRCIKPNDEKTSSGWNYGKVHDQLKNTGIFKAITIRKYGFSQRVPHAEFYCDYMLVLPDKHVKALPADSNLKKAHRSWFRLGKDWNVSKEDVADLARQLLVVLEVPPEKQSDIQVGTSKVLFRMGLEAQLETAVAIRRKGLADNAVKLQKFIRKLQEKKRLQKEGGRKVRMLYDARRTLREAILTAAAGRDAKALASAVSTAEQKLAGSELSNLTQDVKRGSVPASIHTLIGHKLNCATRLASLREETLPKLLKLAISIQKISQQPDAAAFDGLSSDDDPVVAVSAAIAQLEAALTELEALDKTPRVSVASYGLDASESLMNAAVWKNENRQKASATIAAEKQAYVAWLEKDCARAKQVLTSEAVAIDSFASVAEEGRAALEHLKELKAAAIKRAEELRLEMERRKAEEAEAAKVAAVQAAEMQRLQEAALAEASASLQAVEAMPFDQGLAQAQMAQGQMMSPKGEREAAAASKLTKKQQRVRGKQSGKAPPAGAMQAGDAFEEAWPPMSFPPPGYASMAPIASKWSVDKMNEAEMTPRINERLMKIAPPPPSAIFSVDNIQTVEMTPRLRATLQAGSAAEANVKKGRFASMVRQASAAGLSSAATSAASAAGLTSASASIPQPPSVPVSLSAASASIPSAPTSFISSASIPDLPPSISTSLNLSAATPATLVAPPSTEGGGGSGRSSLLGKLGMSGSQTKRKAKEAAEAPTVRQVEEKPVEVEEVKESPAELLKKRQRRNFRFRAAMSIALIEKTMAPVERSFLGMMNWEDRSKHAEKSGVFFTDALKGSPFNPLPSPRSEYWLEKVKKAKEEASSGACIVLVLVTLLIAFGLHQLWQTINLIPGGEEEDLVSTSPPPALDAPGAPPSPPLPPLWPGASAAEPFRGPYAALWLFDGVRSDRFESYCLLVGVYVCAILIVLSFATARALRFMTEQCKWVAGRFRAVRARLRAVRWSLWACYRSLCACDLDAAELKEELKYEPLDEDLEPDPAPAKVDPRKRFAKMRSATKSSLLKGSKNLLLQADADDLGFEPAKLDTFRSR